MKCKLINVYSIEYFKDPARTIDKIIKAIDIPYVKEEMNINPVFATEAVEAFKYDSIQYRNAYISTRISYDNDYGYDSRLRSVLSSIIDAESPVSFETIKTKVRENSNIQNMSSKAKARLEMALRSFDSYSTNDQTQRFYWSSSMFNSQDLKKFRVGSKRDLYDISKEEILCAMKQILDVQGEIENLDDLFRLTLAAFDYGSAVLNTKNQERLQYVYNWAKRSGKL